ncbi:MAG: leucyl aminopeptidase family protein [Phycisphaerales bacterium]
MYKKLQAGSSTSAVTIVGVYKGTTRVPASLKDIDQTHKGALATALGRKSFRAEAGDLTETADDSLLVLGLGEEDAMTPRSLRLLGARLLRGLDRRKIAAASLDFITMLPEELGNEETTSQAVAEGIGLANWRIDFFDGSARERNDVLASLRLSAPSKPGMRGLQRGLTLAESTNYARRIAATPPNICNPTFMAQEARRLAKAQSLKCTVISFAEAKKRGMGGIVNVGQASTHKPCLIQLEYTPARTAKKAKGETIVLVGKTITYDTGGYSLKISNGMKGMKYDKCGGMAVLGAMHAIATLKLPIRVIALLPTAENMLAGDAYRPDDIITMHNGVSVEVTNTDAEGRLVLADALAYACKSLKPTAIIDLATLTGGVVVALGSWCAGMWCNDDRLIDTLLDAAEATGERLWELPLWPDHRDFMRARHADVWNSGPKRDGHPIQGAAFLSYFVDKDIPWARLDIAGVARVESETDICTTGPTGFGVRLLIDALERMC